MDNIYQLLEVTDFNSKYLGRPLRLDVYTPPSKRPGPYPILLLNDGQDAKVLHLREIIEYLSAKGEIRPIVVVAVHAGERIREYGVARKADYKGRGDRAQPYDDCIIKEVLPWLETRFPVDSTLPFNAIAGFSLGGLSAFDIGWNHPERFSRIGVFSGAFWWRSKAWSPRDPDGNRIAHRMVERGRYNPGQRFWFQAGAHDETSDRNQNGVIDAIDDTLDLIVELTHKGYRPFHDIQYYEMPDGHHNPSTWSRALPLFLKWAFPAA